MRRLVGDAVVTCVLVALVLSGVGCGQSSTVLDGVDSTGMPDFLDSAGDSAADGPSDAIEVTGELPWDVAPFDSYADVDAAPLPCTKDEDCLDAQLGEGEPCHRKKTCRTEDGICVFDWETNCCRQAVILEEGFEAGLADWTVVDPNPKDRVAWSISGHRMKSGTGSLYFGDPQCHTYYTGALDGSCVPVDVLQSDATVVRGGATSSPFFLPPLDSTRTVFKLSFEAFIDSQPIVPGAPTQPDQFRLLVVQDPGGNESTATVFTSVDVQKTTGGSFMRFAGDLSRWAGQTIALRLFFDSQDEVANFYEGVYVDDLKVETTCVDQAHPVCQTGSTCPDDGLLCTNDACLSFCNAKDKGICEYLPVPSCIEPECTSENVVDKCQVTGECDVASCPSGFCEYRTLPPEVCCNRTLLFTAPFDGGLDGFSAQTVPAGSDVRWQLSTKRSVSGGSSLYYGNLDGPNFAGDLPTIGEATSSPQVLPAQGYSFLSFQLFLSTEFDDLTGANYNPLGRDRFEVIVVEAAGSTDEVLTTVWSSDNVNGTTRKQFVPVGIDMTRFAGRTVRLRFRFDPVDAVMNDYEGVYIDDLNLSHDPCVLRDCKGIYDCSIDGFCRTGSCSSELCATFDTGAVGCCLQTADCDDENQCTIDGCIGGRCFNVPKDGDGCCLARTLAAFTFDVRTDLDGFEIEDLSPPPAGGAPAVFALSDLRSHSPERSMRFGNVTGYYNGGISRGMATSPSIAIPSSGRILLNMALLLDVESDPTRDLFRVDVMDGEVPTVVLDKTSVPAGDYGSWYEVSDIDLSVFAGRVVRLRFVFDSVDDAGNDGLGMFVDDVSVRKLCP